MVMIRVLRAVAMASAGAVVTLAQLNLPSKHLWDRHIWLQWSSVVILAILVCYDAVLSVNHIARARRVHEYDENLRIAMCAVLSTVVQVTAVPWDEIAVHYFRKRGVLVWCKLEHVKAVRMGPDTIQPWDSVRPGVGIVGTAFAAQETIGVQWRDFLRSASASGRSAWEARSRRDRFGMAWGQLRRSVPVLGLIASPTFDADGKPVGCVVLSGPLKLPDLSDADVLSSLDDCSVTLDRIGPPPRGWWARHER
ncbi:hypothetical protein [Kribbella speibonae]|uniref:GAF domain-containing protein n=1 Tax=Kribbella speibonae TaxID=1572660 RepID=A0ABY2A5I4_9ACTN|nr:hypothetical protein [Kribbella speibonae]TCC22762.1 hypothetical protein E0H58_20475 [Kribbella speibonae]